MQSPVLRIVLASLALGAALPVASLAQKGSDAKPLVPQWDDAETRQVFNGATTRATTTGATRYAEIIKALSQAGYILKATSNPEAWIITFPATSAPQPAIGIRLFPPEATEEQMNAYQFGVSSASVLNHRLRFIALFQVTYPEAEIVPGSVLNRRDELMSSHELKSRVIQTLSELPDIRTTILGTIAAERTAPSPLKEMIDRLQATKVQAEARRAALLKTDPLTIETLRRAQTWEALAAALEATIEDTQREARGELPAAK
ncbi:hypothetical protein [Rariglobus hedericola]|uniref:Uncharacterized protein n=1 Tax=Rariglobus hedericola TaxID=2597822 RepID=A0A556QJT3_9BACT|nr:hypothetical protein [Rariglobus hedericola]TSJ76913.1 hypothetical protein FPL22_12405 [Rariglobus hedericola]